MEDIAPNNRTPGTLQIGDWSQLAHATFTMRSVSMALGRVKIKLTAGQLQSLANMVSSQLAIIGHVNGHLWLSHLREIYLLNTKLQRKRLTMTGAVKINLTLTMTEASTLYTCLSTIEFEGECFYESTLTLYLMNEIDKQTV